jgi:hypothetical protein
VDVEEHTAAEADDGSFIGKDADDAASALQFAIEPLV